MAASQRRRTVVAVAVAAGLLIGAAVGVRALWHALQGVATADPICTVGAFDISPDQASIAATMVGVVIKRELPERAAVLTLAAALQESKLSNVPAGQGDRDSVGVLQQRPSQGWGTPQQLADVQYATGAFLDALVKIDGWQTANLAATIQKVQVSIDGSYYAVHEPQAQALADALSGHSAAAITCDFARPSQVASVADVVASLTHDLPVNAPVASTGQVSVPGASWATAAWFVANAERLGIDHVDYAGQRWQRSHGWKAKSGVPATAVTAGLATG